MYTCTNKTRTYDFNIQNEHIVHGKSNLLYKDCEIDNNACLSIQKGELIPGVLLLNGNRTYGKNETGKRALYKCIPDNRNLPHFLIPYELKLGFSKDIKNKYIVFAYEHCNDKHPRGIITHTIGDVNIVSAYYEYRLYCRSVHDSICEFTNRVRELTKDRELIYATAVLIRNSKLNLS